MTFKSQCDTHGCSELLCGCHVSTLESSSDYWEQIRAKNKWINELLKENEIYRNALTKIGEANDSIHTLQQNIIMMSVLSSEEVKQAIKKARVNDE